MCVLFLVFAIWDVVVAGISFLLGGAVVLLFLLPQTTGSAGAASRRVLDAVLASVAVLSLFGLVAAWVPEWQWIPPEIREAALALPRDVYQLEPLRQLTAEWDWQRLRLMATVWVALEGLGLWTTRGLPIPLASTSATVAVMGLAVLQYAAVGGEQPVWAIEHLLVHLMDLAGFTPSDLDALRHFTRANFAARSSNSISLQSQRLSRRS